MTALIFPGQGSQSVGMLGDVYESYAEFQDFLKRLEDETSLSLIVPALEGPKELLDSTTTTQPVLLAFCLALHHVWQSQSNKTVDMVAGHSLANMQLW